MATDPLAPYPAPGGEPFSSNDMRYPLIPWAESLLITPFGASSPFIGAFGQLIAQQETPIIAISFPYNINAAYVTSTTANGGTVTQANSQAVLQTSTAANGSAQLESNFSARYSPGQGQVARFTGGFTLGKASSQQELGIGDVTDGFFFGYQNAVFGLFKRQNGTDLFVPQASWNADPMDGTGPSGVTLNPLKGNVFAVRYQWLGYGAIKYYVEEPSTGTPLLVHTLAYSNANIIPSIFNPSLPLHAKVINSGNTSNLTMFVGSMGVYSEGPANDQGAPFATGNSKTGVTTEVAVFSLQNQTTVFSGKTNRARCRLDNFSWGLSNLGFSRIVLNPTLGGSPSFTALDANTSIVAVDTAGTTVTGGREIRRVFASGGQQWNESILTPISFRWNPGDILTFTAGTTGGGITANAAASWREEL